MVWRNIVRIAAAGAGAVFTALRRAIIEELNGEFFLILLISDITASRQAAASQASTDPPNVSRVRQKKNEIDLRMGITTQEAMQILDVKPPLTVEEVKRRYEHLFAANEKSKGGTLYLQAKIYRAKERMDAELERIAGETDEKTKQESN